VTTAWVEGIHRDLRRGRRSGPQHNFTSRAKKLWKSF